MKEEIDREQESLESLPLPSSSSPQRRQGQQQPQPSTSSSFISSNINSPPQSSSTMMFAVHHRSPQHAHSSSSAVGQSSFRLPPITQFNDATTSSSSSSSSPPLNSFETRATYQTRRDPSLYSYHNSTTEPQFSHSSNSRATATTTFDQKSGTNRHFSSDCVNVPEWQGKREQYQEEKNEEEEAVNDEYMHNKSGQREEGEMREIEQGNEGVRPQSSGYRSTINDDVKQQKRRFDQHQFSHNQNSRQQREYGNEEEWMNASSRGNEIRRRQIDRVDDRIQQSNVNIKSEEGSENKYQSVKGGVIRAVSMRDDRGESGNVEIVVANYNDDSNRNIISQRNEMRSTSPNDRETATTSFYSAIDENQTVSNFTGTVERNFPQPYQRPAIGVGQYPHHSEQPPPLNRSTSYSHHHHHQSNPKRLRIDAMAANLREGEQDATNNNDEGVNSAPLLQKPKDNLTTEEQPKSASRLPSIASFHQYDDSASSSSNVTRMEGRDLPSINTLNRPIGLEGQGRTTSFLSSLMRAAGSPDATNSPNAVQSPMSVHTIIAGRSSSPLGGGNNERTSRKRRTSSVQEPLQGSVLLDSSDSRAQSSPRLLDQDSRHSFKRSQTFTAPLYSNQSAKDRIVDVQHTSITSPYQSGALPFDHNRSRPPLPKLSPDHDRTQFVTRNSPPDWQRGGIEGSGRIQDHNDFRIPPPPTTDHPSFRHPSSHHYPPASQHYSHQQQYPHARGPSTSPYASNRIVSDSTYSRYSAPIAGSPHSMHEMHSYGGGSGYLGGQGGRSFQMENPTSKSTQRQFPSNVQRSSAAVVSNDSSSHWNEELHSLATIEQERWSQTSMHERRKSVIQSVWDARKNIRSGLSYWPPLPSNVTTIRCMYANIAQKSYGSEKRFLCPPPVVKIDGPLRPCKWVSMRVVSGDSLTPSVGLATAANNIYGTGMYGNGGANQQMNMGGVGVVNTTTTGGEESAILDSQNVARFGKLHVGSISDGVSKVFRLQINLLRAEKGTGNDSKGGNISQRPSQPPPPNYNDNTGPLQLPYNAWSTFHSSPINVISKPARKSVRTRAASPAIASGSIVCLYNRLNSQTVRTKYLGIEQGSIEDCTMANVEVARKLIARQDGWEGFSIELLARPVNDPAVIRANARGIQSDEWGITYGSIICLRDVNSKLCSDPMLLCKVDKGKVELSNTLGNAMNEQGGRIRFQITSRNREEARQILFGGTRGGRFFDDRSGNPSGLPSSFTSMSGSGVRTEGSDVSSADSPRSASTQQQHYMRGNVGPSIPSNSIASTSSEVNSSVGGPVIQMQKVTLMHVTPLPSAYSPDEVECDLQGTRSYLCSTVSENVRSEPNQMAIARSQRRLQSRSIAVRQGALQLPIDELNAPAGSPISTFANVGPSSSNTIGQPITAEQIQSAQAQAAPVGFMRPPTVLYSATGSVGRPGSVDVLEDQFCWTIVTISCTEVSYIEANAGSNNNAAIVASSPTLTDHKMEKGMASQKYPHLPLSPLPITPFPCLAAQPSYDSRTHCFAATIHDYLFSEGLENARNLLNTVSAVHAVPNKAAHEIWLGQSGPLRTHASSAGPHMSDVTVQLPNMEELMNLHIEYHSDEVKDENVEDVRQQQQRKEGKITNVIRLPILFVRISQGITFPSGHWLMAEHVAHSHGVIDHSIRSRYDPFSWSFRITS